MKKEKEEIVYNYEEILIYTFKIDCPYKAAWSKSTWQTLITLNHENQVGTQWCFGKLT